MKTTLKLFLIPFLAAGMVACESIKSLADVEFGTNMSTDLNIAVQQAQKSSPEAFAFSAEATLDPTSDPEVAKYADKIKKYQVTSLTAKVSSTTSPGVVFKAGTWFRIADGNDETGWTLAEDFTVNVGSEYTLDNKDGQWGTVQNILGRNAEFKVSCAGEASETGVTVVMEVSIGATVTANPL